MNTQGQDYVLDHTGATECTNITLMFDGMNAWEIKNKLNEIFPTEDNTFLASAIEYELSK